MNQDFDIFDRAEKPSMTLCNPDKVEIYSLDMAYGVVYTPKLNTLSELSFMMPSNINNNDIEAYDYVLRKRLVLLGDLGYFHIVDVDEDLDGIVETKKVSCISLESKSINKRIVGFSGTYQFYDPISPDGTLLQEMLDRLPSWSVGTVSGSLLTKYRTFSIDDNSIYNFMMTDVSTAYECIFVFDTINNTISAYTIADATTDTDIFLSFDNLIKSGSLKGKDDEITTVLYVYGAGNLDIRTVNPLGGTAIYNFDYYKTTDWMTQDLIDAITAWEALGQSLQSSYSALLSDVKGYNEDLVVANGELSTLQNEYLALEGVQKARIEADLDYSDINILLASKQAEIVSKETEVSSIETSISAGTADLVVINNALSFDNNFTEAQYESLSEFMFENTYQNENFVETDIMTPDEIQEVAQDLYDQGVNVLSKIAIPRYEFNIEAVNFLFLKEFEEFKNQLELGANITIDFGDGTSTESTVLEFVVAYDNPSDFSMVLSNRLRLDNESFTFSDLVGETVKTGNSVNFGKLNWENWETVYKNDVSNFITSSLDASTNNVVNAENQEILINQNGLRGRQSIGGGLFSDEQVWLTSSILAFTDDNWETARAALGKVTVGGGEEYGLIADVVVGRLLAGNKLTIETDDGSLTVDNTGTTLYNSPLTIETASGKNRIYLNPDDGILIESNILGSWETQFSVDSSGNVIFAGDLSGATGTFSGTIEANDGLIGGWTINSTGLYDPYGNYIRSDGKLKVGALEIDGATATFTGDIYATNLIGNVVDSQIASGLNAGKMTYGNMSGNRIYGGTIQGAAGDVYLDGFGGWWYLDASNVYIDSGGSIFLDSPSIGIGSSMTVSGSGVFLSPTNIYVDGNVGRTDTVYLSYYSTTVHLTKKLNFRKGLFIGWSYG